MEEEKKVDGETLEAKENGETSEKAPETVELEQKLQKKTELADNYKVRAEKAEKAEKDLERELNQKIKSATGEKPSLNVEDYIDISASLEGLDQREKERLAKEHKLTGRPLTEIRNDEDFQLWQKAYRDKVEKERLALKPTGTQSESDRPMSLTERLSKASLAEKEKILTEAGLYKSPRPRSDRVNIDGFKK